MSTTVHKTALRLPIPSLSGRPLEDVVAYFTEFLGEPEEVDGDENGLYYFGYPSWYEKNKTRSPMDFIHPVTDNKGNWAFEILLALSLDGYNHETGLCPECLHGKPLDTRAALELAETLRLMGYEETAPCELVSYSWYNGGDEPVKFNLFAW